MRPTGKGDWSLLRHEAFVRSESQLQALPERRRSFSGIESCSALGTIGSWRSRSLGAVEQRDCKFVPCRRLNLLKMGVSRLLRDKWNQKVWRDTRHLNKPKRHPSQLDV